MSFREFVQEKSEEAVDEALKINDVYKLLDHAMKDLEKVASSSTYDERVWKVKQIEKDTMAAIKLIEKVKSTFNDGDYMI